MSQHAPTVAELFEGVAPSTKRRAKPRATRGGCTRRSAGRWQDGQVVWIQPEEIQIDGPDQEPDSGE